MTIFLVSQPNVRLVNRKLGSVELLVTECSTECLVGQPNVRLANWLFS
jgi:hypothetical protein